MVKKKKFLKAYYLILFLYAIIGLIFTIFITGKTKNYGQISSISIIVSSLFSFSVFVLSIIAIPLFVKNKYKKITLFMPIYHIAANIISFVYGIIWGLISYSQGNPISNQTILPGFFIIGLISSTFELIFTSYILKKFVYKN